MCLPILWKVWRSGFFLFSTRNFFKTLLIDVLQNIYNALTLKCKFFLHWTFFGNLISKLYTDLNFISFEILELSKNKMESLAMSDNGM